MGEHAVKQCAHDGRTAADLTGDPSWRHTDATRHPIRGSEWDYTQAMEATHCMQELLADPTMVDAVYLGIIQRAQAEPLR